MAASSSVSPVPSLSITEKVNYCGEERIVLEVDVETATVIAAALASYGAGDRFAGTFRSPYLARARGMAQSINGFLTRPPVTAMPATAAPRRYRACLTRQNLRLAAGLLSPEEYAARLLCSWSEIDPPLTADQWREIGRGNGRVG